MVLPRRAVRLVVLGALLGSGAGLAGCVHHSTGSADVYAGRGTPVTNPNEPEPSRDPNLGSGPVTVGVAGIRVELEERVVETAGVRRPVTSECDTQAVARAFTCRVTYAGETVTYAVTTTPPQPGSTNLSTWNARSDAMIVTRVGVWARMWRTYAMRATEMRCDNDLPDVQRVPVGHKLAQRCYFRPTVDDAAYGAKSHNHDRTVAVELTVDDGSIRLDVKQP
jgi:hypothetical protein